MMALDDIKEMIVETRRSEAAVKPFPSGVAAGDDRVGFLNASEAGRCTRWLWYDKHGVAGEKHQLYGVFDRGHAYEHWFTIQLDAGLARAGGRLLYAGAKQKRMVLPDFRLAGTPDGLIDMAGPVRERAGSEVARQRAKLRQRPERNACSPGRDEHRAVPRGHHPST